MAKPEGLIARSERMSVKQRRQPHLGRGAADEHAHPASSENSSWLTIKATVRISDRYDEAESSLKKRAYVDLAERACRYVEEKMDIGASNKIGPGMIAKMLCAGGTFNKGELRSQVDKDLARIKHPTWKDVLESSADWAKHYGCGNCGEQSALAFVFLRSLDARPLDWIEVGNFSHAFVVLGRVAGSDPGDYNTWGRSSAYCDPWAGDWGEGAILHLRYLHKRMNSLYRLD